MDEPKIKLQEEINSVLNTLSTLSPDSEKYKQTVEVLETLYELQNSEKKIELDFQEKEARREMEERHHTDETDAAFCAHRDEIELQKKQHRFQIISFAVGTVVTAATTAVYILHNGHWLKKSFKFEEDGTISGATSRGIWNSLFKSFKK